MCERDEIQDVDEWPARRESSSDAERTMNFALIIGYAVVVDSALNDPSVDKYKWAFCMVILNKKIMGFLMAFMIKT
ncbi:hypothetical protein PV326_004521 [Microctonus aethiopoides]|nr:hypothetical protein PV326_004521 [Microctonus aethiopoides]